VFAGGERVIVDRTVDGTALTRVINAMPFRRSMSGVNSLWKAV
jgi:hypothetical protein